VTQDQDLARRVLEQPGDIARAEAVVSVARAGGDDPVEALVLHQPPEGVPHGAPSLDPRVNRHPQGRRALLEGLEQGKGPSASLLRGVSSTTLRGTTAR
jgi:hypothetical protein